MTATTTRLETTMQELNRRIAAAVARSVAKGVDQKTAFANHMKALATEYPQVFGEYVRWLGLAK